jgi:hypothetical protein
LGRKLSALDYQYEVAALLLHELVHLAGQNERTAFQVQKQAVYDLRKEDLNRFLYELEIRCAIPLREVLGHLDWIKQYTFPGQEGDFLREQVSRMLAAHYIYWQDWGRTLSPLSAESMAMFWSLHTKASAWEWYAEARHPGYSPDYRKQARKRYEDCFRVGTEIDVSDCLPELGGPTMAPLRLTKISNQAIWRREISEAEWVLEELTREVEKLRLERFQSLSK